MVETQTLQVKVTAEEWAAEPANPLTYGNFVELGFGRQIEGLWSELLCNRSFENVPPYNDGTRMWLRRKEGDDLTRERWWHSGYEEKPWYLAPGNADAQMGFLPYHLFHHGVRGAGVRNRSESEPARLAQDGVYLRRGVAYRFRGYFKTGEMGLNPPTVTVTVGLYPEGDFSRPLAEHTFEGIGGEWSRREVEFSKIDFEGRATFAATVGPKTTAHLDGFSLMPGDNVQGWRKDVVEALKRVHPRIIRYPGGCFASFYNWRDGIGPDLERQPRESVFWGGLEYNDAGTVEFVNLCRAIEAEPFLVVNVLTGTADEAAAWVAYCNAPTDHPMGALRARHGHPEPLGVTYWELDNEAFRRYGPLEYAQRSAEYARAMKAADPNIKVVMIGYSYLEQLPQMLDIAGPYIDLVTDRSLLENILRKVIEMIEDYNKKAGSDIRLCNTEWIAPLEGVFDVPTAEALANLPPDVTLQNAQIQWQYAMNAARQLLTFQRLGGRFVFSNFNNLANTWGQNVIECPKEGVYLSATGRVFELFTDSPVAWALKLEGVPEDKHLALQAAWDKDRKALVLEAVNYKDAPVAVDFDLATLSLQARHATVTTLTADSLDAFNTLAKPDAVTRKEKQEKLKSTTTYRLAAPPRSVVQVVLR